MKTFIHSCLEALEFQGSNVLYATPLPSAPWRQGSVESLISSFKRCLYWTIPYKAFLTDIELMNLLVCVTSHVNRRPLCILPMSMSSPEDQLALSPAELSGHHSGCWGEVTSPQPQVMELFELLKQRKAKFQEVWDKYYCQIVK